MKKLFTLCLLVAITLTTQAQQKPTKEETILFMNRVLLSTQGIAYYYGSIITKTNITNNNYEYSEIPFPDISNDEEYFEYSMIKWEDFNPNRYSQSKESLNGLHSYTIFFTSKIKLIITEDGHTKTTYEDEIEFLLPEDKLESFIKACQRLSEIAKEENKDPFEE